MSERGKTQRFFRGTTPDHLKVNHASVLSRIYCLGEVPSGRRPGTSKRDPGACPLGNFLNEYALWCNLVHFETKFWEMLRWYFIFFFSHNHVPCHVLSLDREYLLHVHWPGHVWMIFPKIISYLYTVMITIYRYLGGGGELGILGEDSTPQIP